MAGNKTGGTFSTVKTTLPSFASDAKVSTSSPNISVKAPTYADLYNATLDRAHIQEDVNNTIRKEREEKRKKEQKDAGISFYHALGHPIPGDTRAAQVLAALGVIPDIMKALVLSAQLPPGVK